MPDLPEINSNKLEGSLTVMPSYYLPKKSSGGSLSTKTILIIVASVILLLLVIVTTLLVTRSREDAQNIAQVPVTSTPEPSEQPASQPPVTTTQTEESEDNITEEPDDAISEPEEILPESERISLPAFTIAGLIAGQDTDQDGLTDSEELLFSTSAAAPDTDQDSFLDGAEVANLYDPATPGALLEVSPQIKIARNSSRGYQLLIPESFTFQSLDTSGSETRVIVPNGPEIFNIKMIENVNRMSPVQWLQDLDPTTDLSSFNNFTNEAGWSGIQSQDGRVVVATFGDSGPGARAFIFLMYYDPGEKAELSYPSIWKMMLQSLSVAETETQEFAGQSTVNP